MPYIDRDLYGNIVGIYEVAQRQGQEFVQNAVLYVPNTPLSQQAKIALDKSDVTMLRCVEAAITVPVEWNNYRKSLRAISNGSDTISTVLPPQPAYPAGT